jgi:hypothetical protein
MTLGRSSKREHNSFKKGGLNMPVNLSAILRKTARQLEAEKTRINRQLTVIRGLLRQRMKERGK